MPSLARFALVVATVVLVGPGPATSQSATTGAIHGVVTDSKTRQPIEAVTVLVTSTARGIDLIEVTDENGAFKVTDLPPGDYLVSFTQGSRIVHRSVHVGANQSVSVYQQMLEENETIWVDGSEADVDTQTPQQRTKIPHKLLQILPQSGGSQADAAMMAPGTDFDGAGVGIGGSSSFENRTFVDGADTTGLQFGTLGTPVLNDFIEEVEVITGGYNAEYGRATGGFINAVTRSGTDALHGSVFGYVSPGALIAARERTPSQISPIDARRDLAYQTDFGADLGGPIIKGKAWFYLGLAPSLTRYDTTRRVTRRTDCRRVLDDGTLSECDRRPLGAGGNANGAADVDPETELYITEELDRSTLRSSGDALSALAKLNVAPKPEHQGQLSVIAQPQRGLDRGAYGVASATSRDYQALTTDVSGKWVSKLHDNATELEAVVGWHRSTYDSDARDDGLNAVPAEVLRLTTLDALADYGGESADTVAGCTDQGADDPYPLISNCPDEGAGYRIGGPGAIAHDREDRRSIRLGVTRRQRALGSHEVKAGLDLEDNTLERARLLSGGAFLDNLVARGSIEAIRWVQLAPIATPEARFDNTCRDTGTDHEYSCDYLRGDPGAPGTTITGRTLNWAAFVRDSWQLWPNLVVDAGLRYEEQRLRYAEELQGTTDVLTGNHLDKNAMVLRGMIAPRVGVVYDWTGEGRAKAYAHWGRFYESIPMQINDRSFGGEVQYRQTFDAMQCGQASPNGVTSGSGCLADEGLRPALGEQLFGSSGVLVAPGLAAQYMDEALAGVEMEVARDTKLGISVQHRSLGRVIEDVSTDGAQTYIIANPGEWSDSAEADLMARIARTTDPDDVARLQHELELFRGIRLFDKPKRDHTALHITLSRRLARNLFVQASYVYARTRGNYPGLLSYDNGQADPNISSQYDLIELLANRNGALPQDRPHHFKLDAAYVFQLGKVGALTVSGRVRAMSGVPIDALAPHYAYGGDESFLLPRGALGRTSFEHGIDLHVGYGRALGKTVAVEVFADLFNVYNRQGTFNVDESYALDFPGNAVNPIVGGTYEDLIWAKGIDADGVGGTAPVMRNPNFRRPTVRYAPFSARLGARLTF